MKTRTAGLMITLLALGATMPAAAEFVTVAEAHEVILTDLRLPQSEGGTIAYKSCSECPYVTKLLGADIAWELNGRNTSLDKFRAALDRASDRANVTVAVLHHLRTDRVIRVSVYLP